MRVTTSGSVILSNAHAKLVGSDSVDYSGATVSTAGDVNGDGLDDVLVGSPSWWGQFPHNKVGTTVELVHSPVTGSFHLANADGVVHDGSWQPVNSAVAGGGDFNGDGLDDIIVGSQDYHRAYLILGPASGYHSYATADVVFSGDYVYNALAISGDCNGDGYDDILLGGYGANKTYLVLGRPN